MFYKKHIKAMELFSEELSKEARKRIIEFIPLKTFKSDSARQQYVKACENAIALMTRSIIKQSSHINHQNVYDLIAKTADNKTEVLAVLEPTFNRIAPTSLFKGYSATIRRKDITSVEVNLSCWIADIHGIEIIEREGTRLSCNFRIPAYLWMAYLRKIEMEMHRLCIKDAEEMHKLTVQDTEKLRMATQSNPQQ